MFRRGTAIACLAMSVVSIPAMAFAAPTETTSTPSSVVVGGRTFGPQDGIVLKEAEIPAHSGRITPMANTSNPNHPYWGSSYADNKESYQYIYDGTSFAAANVDEGKRIIQICHTYRRDGQVLKGPTCSNATYGGGWKSGGQIKSQVKDTLNPVANKTRFSYSHLGVNPSSTGS